VTDPFRAPGQHVDNDPARADALAAAVTPLVAEARRRIERALGYARAP
jgi:hypothetical protein